MLTGAVLAAMPSLCSSPHSTLWASTFTTCNGQEGVNAFQRGWNGSNVNFRFVWQSNMSFRKIHSIDSNHSELNTIPLPDRALRKIDRR